MVATYLKKASLLIAVFLVLVPTSTGANTEIVEPSQSSSTPPCDIVFIGTTPPFIDLHPECVPDIWPSA